MSTLDAACIGVHYSILFPLVYTVGISYAYHTRFGSTLDTVVATPGAVPGLSCTMNLSCHVELLQEPLVSSRGMNKFENVGKLTLHGTILYKWRAEALDSSEVQLTWLLWVVEWNLQCDQLDNIPLDGSFLLPCYPIFVLSVLFLRITS